MGEIWKPVKGFEGRYEVSNFGKVKNCKSGRFIGSDANGYLRVVIGGVPKRINILVWDHFGDRPRNGLVVDHIDGNKHNNKINNLQLLTLGMNSSKTAKRYCETGFINICIEKKYDEHIPRPFLKSFRKNKNQYILFSPLLEYITK